MRSEQDFKMMRDSLHEGELPGDEESKEFDDGYDENLMGDEEDRKKLAQMTEKEREQELFNRSERRETLKIRFEIERKLRTKAKKREQEKKQNQHVRARKRLRASEIYSSDETSEDSDEYTPDIRHTKSLSGNDTSNSKPASKMSTRNSTAAAASNLLLSSSESSSASADSSAGSSGESESDSDDDDDDNHERHTKAHHDDQDERQSLQDDFEMTLADLRSLQLKRDKVEKWVYAPFFRETAIGLFVKISVGSTGLNNSLQPIQHMYKVAQIVDVSQGNSVYPINEEGKYKTDKQCTVRIGRAERTYKMSFVSNRGFDEDDYNRWRDQILEGQGHPSREHFLRKRRDLQRAFNYEYTDEDIAYEVTERSRFKDHPYNFALKKTELMGEKADAEASNDYERASQIQAIIDELETKARELEKTRSSSTFSAISFVNERNRYKNMVESEKALKESKSVKTEDPFTRRKCAPTIVHNKNNNGDILNNTSSSASNDKNGKDLSATPNQHQRTTNNTTTPTSNNYDNTSSTSTTTATTTSSSTTCSLSNNNGHANNKSIPERVKSVDDLFQAHASIDLELDIDI